MAKVLRNLRIDDVSSVDVGAGRGVRVVLTKRNMPSLYESMGPDEIADLSEEVADYLKREFSGKERQARAESGHALPDGSFPIDNKEDLGNAVQAIGRAKDPAKAKAHIKARASALGASDMLPDSWSKSLTKADVLLIAERNVFAKVCKAAQDFNDTSDAMETADDAGELMCAVRDAMCALDCSIQSILCDDDITDKVPSITTSFNQFKDYLDTLDLEDDADDETEKNMSVTALTTAAVQKMIDEAVTKAAVEKDERIAKLETELIISKMSDAQKTYHDNLGSDADKKKFQAMTPDQRDGEMDKTKKRLSDDPVVKGLIAELETLRKRIQDGDDEKDLKIAKQDAKDLGMTQTDAGDVLMKMRRGDKDAIKKYEGYVQTLAASKKAFEKSSRAFEEIGHTGAAEGEGATAMDAITTMAKALREKDPNLTEAQAFDKAYNDPANAKLRQAEADARMAKIHGRSFAA
jgi:hypothetical protein